MAAKKTVSNGIFERDGKFYMSCGSKDYEINIVTSSSARLIYKDLKRTAIIVPKRKPV